MSGRIAGYALAVYCTALLAGIVPLSQYPWPETKPKQSEPVVVMPPDFKAITDIAERKAAFFEYLLPLVEAENQRLQQLRGELLRMRAKVENGKSLTAKERAQVDAWAQDYEVEQTSLEEMLERLERRIDVLPPAMVLAQAAAESAWGTSRFARVGHNYFGQWCFKEGCGLVPRRRSEGAIHEVTRFTSPQASVTAYFHNINTHSAYHSLRLLRQERNRQDETPSAFTLVGELRSYSERGAVYIEELRAIIRVNALENDLPPEHQIADALTAVSPG